MIDWLIELRKNKGLSTYETAEQSGISQSYYSAIENEKRGCPLNPDIAKAIAKTLEFDWTRFYEQEKNTEEGV